MEPTAYHFILVLISTITLALQNIAQYLHAALGQNQKAKIVKKDTLSSKAPHNKLSNGIDCPYEYILQVYGRNHFAKFIDLLKPELKREDPVLFSLVLEVMDAIHFGAILVDDVADNSVLRKGKPAAHCLYGPSETVNRAYLRITEVINKCASQRPSLIPIILTNLEEIHKGQDISLVWRRDGFEKCIDRESALNSYRHCADLKTGALFRLAGQMVFGSHEKDALMTRVGWYCHLQNDCKNIYSGDVVSAKGSLAEDLRNKEFSFPIIVALYGSSSSQRAMKDALYKTESSPSVMEKRYKVALSALQADETRKVCMEELEGLKEDVSQFATVWGRTEKMTVQKSG